MTTEATTIVTRGQLDPPYRGTIHDTNQGALQRDPPHGRHSIDWPSKNDQAAQILQPEQRPPGNYWETHHGNDQRSNSSGLQSAPSKR